MKSKERRHSQWFYKKVAETPPGPSGPPSGPFPPFLNDPLALWDEEMSAGSLQSSLRFAFSSPSAILSKSPFQGHVGWLGGTLLTVKCAPP